MGKRTSNVSSDVMTAGNMGCLEATDRSKSSDDSAGKPSMLLRTLDESPGLTRITTCGTSRCATSRGSPARRWRRSAASFSVEDLTAAARGYRRDRGRSDGEPCRRRRRSCWRSPARSDLIAGVVGWVDLTARRGRFARGALRAVGRHPPPGPGRARPAVALPRGRPARAARGRGAPAWSTTC